MIRRLLARWADAALRQRVADLTTELDAERRRLTVAQAEIDSLAAVLARDRERIKAEGAAYARQRAEAEGPPQHDQRDYESPSRRIA
jgi:hypothetical protein